MTGYRVAVAGATGAVGQELLRLLSEREFPVRELRPLASARSVGRRVSFAGEELPVAELTDAALADIDVAFFSCGGARSRRFVPAARERGVVVIDNSSAFRLEPDVPLVIPEINPDAALTHAGLLAVPNCTTIVFLMAVAPLHREAGLVRAVVSSYQAASGAGQAALDEYAEQTRAAASGRALTASALPHVLHGNVIPHVGEFRPDGSTTEEQKFTDESRRILEDDSVAIAATCVRVPVARAHSVSAALEFRRPLSAERARRLLEAAPGVEVGRGAEVEIDVRGAHDYPTPLDATGRLEVLVGRVREDPTRQGALMLWAVGDQLLKGAAWNAVQIAELLRRKGRL